MLYFHLIGTSHPQFCPFRKHLLFSLLIFGRVSGAGNRHPIPMDRVPAVSCQ